MNNKYVLNWKFMKNDSQTSLSSLSGKISQSLINGAQPVAAVTSATKAPEGKSTMRVSSLDSMTFNLPATDSRGLKIQDKSSPAAEKPDEPRSAKVLTIKPGAN